MAVESLSLKCPDCGASIPVDGRPDVAAVRCAHCGNTVAVPAILRRLPGPSGGPAPRVTTTPLQATFAWAFFLAVAILLAGLFAWRGAHRAGSPAAMAGGGTIPPRVTLPVVRATTPDGHGVMVTALQLYEGTSLRAAVAMFEPGTPKPRWTQVVGGSPFVVADNARVYTAAKNRISAFDLASGALLWQGALADEIQGACRSCLLTYAGRLAVHTTDDTLQIFDGASGRVVLTRVLGRPNHLAVLDDALVVAAADGNGHATTVSVVDGDGRDRRHMALRCGDGASGGLGWSDFTWIDPASGSLVAWYARGDGCIQRYDLRTGTLTWSGHADDPPSPAREPGSVANRSALYLGLDSEVREIPFGHGPARTVLRDPDHGLTPEGADQRLLVVRARRERGTARYELWGIDLASGGRRWQVPLGGARPLDGSDRFIGIFTNDSDSSGFATHLDGGGLRIVRAGGRDGAWISVDVLDPTTGTSRGEKRLVVPGSGQVSSAPSIAAWDRAIAWIVADGKLLGIDTDTGRLIGQHP